VVSIVPSLVPLHLTNHFVAVFRHFSGIPVGLSKMACERISFPPGCSDVPPPSKRPFLIGSFFQSRSLPIYVAHFLFPIIDVREPIVFTPPYVLLSNVDVTRYLYLDEQQNPFLFDLPNIRWDKNS